MDKKFKECSEKLRKLVSDIQGAPYPGNVDDELYYISYADNHIMPDGSQQNQLNYAVSTSPYGPWEYKGVYLGPTGCDTSHGSIVEYKGEWFAFYHNKDLSGQGNLRSICVDKLYYNEDGTIQMVEQTK